MAGGLQQPDYVALAVLGGLERLQLDAVAVQTEETRGRGRQRAAQSDFVVPRQLASFERRQRLPSQAAQVCRIQCGAACDDVAERELAALHARKVGVPV